MRPREPSSTPSSDGADRTPAPALHQTTAPPRGHAPGRGCRRSRPDSRQIRQRERLWRIRRSTGTGHIPSHDGEVVGKVVDLWPPSRARPDGVIGRRSASSRGRTSGKALDHSPAACSSGQQAVLNRVRGCCPGVDADLGEDVSDARRWTVRRRHRRRCDGCGARSQWPGPVRRLDGAGRPFDGPGRSAARATAEGEE